MVNEDNTDVNETIEGSEQQVDDLANQSQHAADDGEELAKVLSEVATTSEKMPKSAQKWRRKAKKAEELNRQYRQQIESGELVKRSEIKSFSKPEQGYDESDVDYMLRVQDEKSAYNERVRQSNHQYEEQNNQAKQNFTNYAEKLSEYGNAIEELNLPNYEEIEGRVFNDSALPDYALAELSVQLDPKDVAKITYHLGHNKELLNRLSDQVKTGQNLKFFAEIGALQNKIQAAEQQAKAKRVQVGDKDEVVSIDGNQSIDAVESKLKKLAQTNPEEYVKAMKAARQAKRG